MSEATGKTVLKSMPAQVAENTHTLVLGSMPGVASLTEQQYYAHPRNAFWPIVGALYGIDVRASYAHRLRQLLACGVGLWDIVGQCERKGSLDSDITADSIVVNDVAGLIRRNQKLVTILINGGAATKLFRNHVLPQLHAQMRVPLCIAMPSTSPANARLSIDDKIAAWRTALEKGHT
jgi:double-stranded uracil-DNA glycosylase